MNKRDEAASRAVNRRVESLFECWLSEGDNRTQTELSKKSGISQPTISRIMTGDCHMGVYTLYKICKCFDIPADYILESIGTAEKSKCVYETSDSSCVAFSEDDYKAYCVQGPCPLYRTIGQVKMKIKKLRKEEFMLQMNDHWSKEDYAKDKELREEIKRLEKLAGEDGNADEERP